MIDAHERLDATVIAAQFEDLVDHGAIFALELAGHAGRRDLVGARLGVNAQHAVFVGAGAAGNRAVKRGERRGQPAAGQPHAVRDVRDHADPRVGVLLARHQEHALVAADVDRQRDRHPGEDDGVVQGDDAKPVHSATRIVGFS